MVLTEKVTFEGIVTMASVAEWREPPQMDIGAPVPGICCDGSDLLLAYVVSSGLDPRFKEFAVVKFADVLQHIFGYPNDEALGGHPLYELGLTFYAFNVVKDSPYIDELNKRNASMFPGNNTMYGDYSHWVVTFHDDTLEVVARTVEVAGRVEATTAHRAIFWYLDSKATNSQ